MTDTPFSATLPDDVPEAIRAMKRQLRDQIGDVQALFDEVSAFITSEIEDIEARKARGEPVWPVIDYADIEAGRVTDEEIRLLHRRGCAVIKGHFPAETARNWDRQLVDYVERNDFDNQYCGPGDDFFGTLAASRPEIYPIYWSPPQMEARQSERMAAVQVFLNRLWKHESNGQTWFDPTQNCIYPDRIRRRPPGTTSKGLGAHTDSGALERWLLPAYQKVFRHLYNGDFSQYDPWDAAYRTEVNEYAGGTTLCSSFRTFQGWTALSDMKHDQGVLFTIPIPAAMAYILLRPLLDDVPEDELCGVSPRRVLPVSEQWHPLLMRGKTTIPDVVAGDSVWWHCDVIHGVDPVEDQQGWGNVMYIPASPWCEKNVQYARQCKERFERGESPDDFPAEHYETEWEGRFRSSDLNTNGIRSFGI
ncbi:DUF1479 domain-containing protein [Saccharospirillum salsuginis]|uniref:DUF1479 domain-containing protein n=1 Tax=Saccharospirillum salsuginis TaxID=418750 RepID=A0A918NA53_9GAMM|nr:DUF1479 domain-containing protein [Saccharospirillum salsuginis]GGX52608.1 hypothetical protein GCM10007392_19980 [Saccharospirillum salsuginis]